MRVRACAAVAVVVLSTGFLVATVAPGSASPMARSVLNERIEKLLSAR
jgi:hypothetical protein